MKSKIAVVAAATLLLGISVFSVAYAAGLWPTLPTVGAAASCGGTSTGASGTQVCTTTIPAGPSIVTGNETIPADTHLASGSQPQSVNLPMASLNALPYNLGNYVTGQAITVSANVGYVVLTPQTGLAVANLTVQMPASPIDGQQLLMQFENGITSLLVSPNTNQQIASPQTLVITAQTQANGVASSSAGSPQMLSGLRYIWNSANRTWWRL